MDCSFEHRKQILVKSIIKAGYSIGQSFMEANKDNLLFCEQVNQELLDSEFAEQMSESLYGDSQADGIFIDEQFFGKDEFVGPYSMGNHWNVLERYFDNLEVEDLFLKGWHQFLKETYRLN